MLETCGFPTQLSEVILHNWRQAIANTAKTGLVWKLQIIGRVSWFP
jgi:hypothetical protein